MNHDIHRRANIASRLSNQCLHSLVWQKSVWGACVDEEDDVDGLWVIFFSVTRERDHESFVISMNFSRFREGTRKFSCWPQVVHSKSLCDCQQLFSGNVGEEYVLQRRLDVSWIEWVLLSLVVGEEVDVEKEKNGKEFFCQTFLYHEKTSHDEQPPLIWFHLFDSDGQP